MSEPNEAVTTCPECGAGTIVDDPGKPSLADPRQIPLGMTGQPTCEFVFMPSSGLGVEGVRDDSKP